MVLVVINALMLMLAIALVVESLVVLLRRDEKPLSQ